MEAYPYTAEDNVCKDNTVILLNACLLFIPSCPIILDIQGRHLSSKSFTPVYYYYL